MPRYRDDSYGDDEPRERRNSTNYLKLVFFGKGLCAIIFGILAVLCQIIAFSTNQLSEIPVDQSGGITYACGWNKYINKDGPDPEVTFAELCDLCGSDDCAVCTNKEIGEMWLMMGLISFFVCIGAIVATVIYWFLSWSCLNCWIKILFAISVMGTIGAVIQFIWRGDCIGCCFDGEGKNEPAALASMFWAILAGLLQGVATLCTCVLG
eukprot:325486_1